MAEMLDRRHDALRTPNGDPHAHCCPPPPARWYTRLPTVADSSPASNRLDAKVLGIDLSDAEIIDFQGIAGATEGLVIDIIMRVAGLDSEITIPVAFVDERAVDVLLGQEGFFEHFRIKFEKDHDTFEISPTKKKRRGH